MAELNVVGFTPSKLLDKDSIFYLRHKLIVRGFFDLVSSFPKSLKGSFGVSETAGNALMLASFAGVVGRAFGKNTVSADSFGKKVDYDSAIWKIFESLMHDKFVPDEVFCQREDGGAWYDTMHISRCKIGSGFAYMSQFGTNEDDNFEHIRLSKYLVQQDIGKEVWSAFGDNIEVSSLIITNKGAENHYFQFSRGNRMLRSLFGKSKRFVDDFATSHRDKLSRKQSANYLLIGKPGLGKTSIINHVAEKLGAKTLSISPKMFESFEISVIIDLLKVMMPDFVMFDDFDRQTKADMSMTDIFRMIDEVKEHNRHTSFIFCANTFSGPLQDEAMLRKGRIDHIFEIELPDASDRTEIVNSYFQEFGVDQSKIDDAISACDGMTGAQIRDLCLSIQTKTVDEYMAIEEKILSVKDKYSPKGAN
jgi:hypothetical protein